MIDRHELTVAGRLTKPHGINGEISANTEFDCDDISSLSAIFVEIDGITVPFFIESCRPKSSETLLLTLSGIETEKDALELCNHDFFAKRHEVAEFYGGEGNFASELIGCEIYDGDEPVGIITAIDNSTENFLFIVETPLQKEIMIPVADELIEQYDAANKRLYMNLPLGLLEM